jgi:hypothetical protein
MYLDLPGSDVEPKDAEGEHDDEHDDNAGDENESLGTGEVTQVVPTANLVGDVDDTRLVATTVIEDDIPSDLDENFGVDSFAGDVIQAPGKLPIHYVH